MVIVYKNKWVIDLSARWGERGVLRRPLRLDMFLQRALSPTWRRYQSQL